MIRALLLFTPCHLPFSICSARPQISAFLYQFFVLGWNLQEHINSSHGLLIILPSISYSSLLICRFKSEHFQIKAHIFNLSNTATCTDFPRNHISAALVFCFPVIAKSFVNHQRSPTAAVPEDVERFEKVTIKSNDAKSILRYILVASNLPARERAIFDWWVNIMGAISSALQHGHYLVL